MLYSDTNGNLLTILEFKFVEKFKKIYDVISKTYLQFIK